MTLIELMITLAISSVVVMAAMAVATSMMSMFQGTARKAQAEGQLALGLAIFDRYLANTGMGFSNPRFSFRVYNNVGTASIPNYDGSTTTPVVTFGAAGAGILSGTDVIEVAMADQGLRRPGALAQPLKAAACTNTTGTCSVQLATADPFLNAELGGAASNALILMEDEMNPNSSWCLGRVQSVTNSVTPTVTFIPLNYNLQHGVASTEGCTVGLPVNATVYVVERRLRFMVYQQAGGTDLGLYVAFGSANGYFPDPSGQPPTLMASGVENLQVRLTIGTTFNQTDNTVGSCTAYVATSQVCITNEVAANVTSMPNIDHSNIPTVSVVSSGNETNWPSGLAFVKSALVELTSRSTASPGGFMPVSMDAPAGSVDGYSRVKAAATAVLMLNGGLPTQ
jgi:hypothetical protein